MSRSTDSEDVGLSKDSPKGEQEGVISAGPLVGRSLVGSILIVGLPVLLQQLMVFVSGEAPSWRSRATVALCPNLRKRNSVFLKLS